MKQARRIDVRRSALLAAALSAILLAAACGPAHTAAPTAAQSAETIRLWPGPAPGTEAWTGPEVELDAELPVAGKVHIVTNVTVPTITVFRPPPGKANGTSVLVIPGGAFRALAWDLDGTESARWLAARGITAFVLKYRVRPPGNSAPSGPESFDAFLLRTEGAREIAAADARQALRLIRRGAPKYGIRPDRVGAIGFSAGAITALVLASGGEADSRPDFVAALYGAMPPGAAPAANAPPLFIAAAQDDPQVPSTRSTQIYESWTGANRPAELHLYAKGGHGFGFRPHDLPVDHWPAALEAWLQAHGFAKAAGGK